MTLKNGRAPLDGVNINDLKTLLESATRHLQSDLSDQLVNTIRLGVSNIMILFINPLSFKEKKNK